MLGATLGLCFANTGDISRTTVRRLVTVRTRGTRLQSTASTLLCTSFLSASNLTGGTGASVATISRLEGVTIVVSFTVVLAGFRAGARTFRFDGDTRCIGSTSVAVSIVVTATNGVNVLWTSTRLGFASPRAIGVSTMSWAVTELPSCTLRAASSTTYLGRTCFLGTAHTTVGAGTGIASIFGRELLTVFVCLSIVGASPRRRRTLALALHRNACCCCFAGVAVGFVVTTTNGINIIGTTLRNLFASPCTISITAVSCQVTVLTLVAFDPGDSTALFGRTGFLSAAHVTVGAGALVTAIFGREGLTIFVSAAIVRASLRYSGAFALRFHRNTCTSSITRVVVRFVVTTANGVDVFGACFRLDLTHTGLVGNATLCAKVTILPLVALDPGDSATLFGRTGFLGTRNVSTRASTGVAPIFGGEGVAFLIDLAVVATRVDTRPGSTSNSSVGTTTSVAAIGRFEGFTILIGLTVVVTDGAFCDALAKPTHTSLLLATIGVDHAMIDHPTSHPHHRPQHPGQAQHKHRR